MIKKTNINAPFISTQITSADYYYLNLTPEKGAEEVVCGGREQCSAAYRIERNHFKFYCIEFVSAGTGTLIIQGKENPLRPGSLFFYGPGIPHTIKTDSSAPLLKHFIDFTGSDLASLVKTTALYKSPLYSSNILRFRTLFETLLATGTKTSRHRQQLCQLLLKQLILTIDEDALPKQEAFSSALQTYVRCRQHIKRNFHSIANIEQAAKECHINPAYLSRLFRRYANEPPLEFLTRLKMGRAADLLSTQQLLIKQVAEECGYSDPYHFSRVFKRVYGIPPDTFIRTAGRPESITSLHTENDHL